MARKDNPWLLSLANTTPIITSRVTHEEEVEQENECHGNTIRCLCTEPKANRCDGEAQTLTGSTWNEVTR
jgi:hypothetical protein